MQLLNKLQQLSKLHGRDNSTHGPAATLSPNRAKRLRSLLAGWLASALCVLSLSSAMANAQSDIGAQDMETPVVNINVADAPTLAERLVGIGLRRAEAIVEYRDTHGKFQDPYELVAVKGVGEATVQKNAARIRLHD